MKKNNYVSLGVSIVLILLLVLTAILIGRGSVIGQEKTELDFCSERSECIENIRINSGTIDVESKLIQEGIVINCNGGVCYAIKN